MKKLILFLCFSPLLTAKSIAQQHNENSLKFSFTESNFGIAFLKGESFPFPGVSFLWGDTHINKKNFIFEYEAGFAFPTLVTAKVGIGKKFDNTQVIIGVRPFPFNLYGQFSFAKSENGYWIASMEFNPICSEHRLSNGILNFGYRRNLVLKKGK